MAVFLIITLLLDVSFTRFLMMPLNRIINKKLKMTKHPSSFDFTISKTNTTDFKYLEESINDMMHKIQNAFNIEKEFIMNVSHELLTPITILQSKFENILADENTPPEVVEKLLESQKTLARLNKIIKTLLLISKIENEQYLKEDAVNLKELITEVIEEIEERLTEKNIILNMQLKEDFVYKNCNKSLLFTMFFNLINNAIKYNKPNGSININGHKEGDKFILEITDTGLGMDKDNIQHIFERFKRFDNKGIEGYGLGLPIVKTILLFHDIDIQVTSDKDVGSTFILFFRQEE
jgi:signal transduction histidine kinase